MKQKNVHFFTLILICLLCAGCVWKYSIRPGTIPPHIKNVAISETENSTAEFNLGQEFTMMLINRMLLDNLLPLADASVAHSVIYTTLRNIQDVVYSYDETEVVKEYRLSLRLDFRWYDRLNDKNIMEKNITDYEIYYSGQYNSTLSPNDQVTREIAMERLMDKLAQKVMVELTSEW
ncbi:MAG: hypothetical protein K0B52_06530 [FCB group bacterium]|nr:hypothetical protein [FCB group bacterium]